MNDAINRFDTYLKFNRIKKKSGINQKVLII